MKILHVISSLEIGGAQKLIEYLVPYLRKDNEVEIVVFKKVGSHIENKLIELGVTIHSLNIGMRSPKAIFKLRKHFKQADIIHLHLFPVNYYSVIANFGLKKKLVYTEHSTHNKRRNHKWLKPIEKFIYKHIDQVVSISPQTKINLDKWLEGKIDFKNIVIENGINLYEYENVTKKSSKELFGKEGYPFIMVSRFTDSKDQDTVVKALQYVNNPDIFIVFAGDGPRKKEVENLVKTLKLEDKVIFLGNRSDVPQLLKSSFAGIQSSHWEGFGLTAVEIMASGIPIIVSNTEGLRQVVYPEGLIFETEDYVGLAKLMDNLTNDKNLYLENVSLGLNHSLTYSIHTSSLKYLNLYKKLAGLREAKEAKVMAED